MTIQLPPQYWPAVKQFYGNDAAGNGLGTFPAHGAGDGCDGGFDASDRAPVRLVELEPGSISAVEWRSLISRLGICQLFLIVMLVTSSSCVTWKIRTIRHLENHFCFPLTKSMCVKLKSMQL